MSKDVLRLDAAGRPLEWLNYEDAARYVTQGKVLWSMGQEIVLRGGHNHRGEQSLLAIPSILSVRGPVGPMGAIPFGRPQLFARDRHVCAYCGGHFPNPDDLSMDHILPESRGGGENWLNAATACKPCNTRKSARTPEEAGMPLLYVPYEPNLHEWMILDNRRIKIDQAEFLLAGVPRHSRLLQ